ncbi:sel1-repeat-containing protein ybeq [Anaeramoeba flamelloides]|uniref:Sel1-repeat-containing protein ybeq n=1 Tax=Anaeramoeba flamelloides TaxID=1746091 RepID=A0ABQ8ZEY6_9EUKA|nr:sel1-repeat-containing protein ybeq [Anaeramoeba flamelloides]
MSQQKQKLIEKDKKKADKWEDNNDRSIFLEFKILAQNGDPENRYRLAGMYLKGIGVAKKPKKAFDIYFDLVNTVKHPLSYEKLGWCYYKGIGVNANFKLAVKNFKISSQKNHDSQFHLANCFRKGFGVEKSLQKFFEWISVATQHENVKAQITIGNLYRKGRLLKKDLFKSSQWYTRAASKGNTYALFNLAMCFKYGYGVQKKPEKAFEMFAKIGQRGLLKGVLECGKCYYYGIGVIRNGKRAFRCFKYAWKRGSFEGLCWIGKCYMDGVSVEKDVNKGFQIIKHSATQNDHYSLFELGKCYMEGRGVKRQYKLGIEYFKKLSKLGHPESSIEIGKCNLFGRGIEKNFNMALRWIEKVAKTENESALIYLGKIYWKGLGGCTRDLAKAITYFETAVKIGSDKGYYQLAKMYEDLGNFNQAFKMYQNAALNGLHPAELKVAQYFEEGKGVQKSLRLAKFYYQQALNGGVIKAEKSLQLLIQLEEKEQF